MDKLIELLKQIQELAGVGVDALQEATKGGKPGGGEGGPPEEGGKPPEGGRPHEGGPPPEEGGKPPGEGGPPPEEKKY